MRCLIALLVAAAALVGCGGDDTLDKADLADRANTICRKYAMRAGALGKPDPANTAAYFTEAEDLARRQQDELETIKPDEELKADFDRLLAANDQATGVLGQLKDVSPDEDAARYADLVSSLEPLRAEVDDAANAVGAQECAG